MRRLLPILFLFLIHPAFAQVPDGFYSVTAQAGPSEMLRDVSEGQALLEYNPLFLDNPEDEALTVLVETGDYVPISLKESPTKTADQTDRTQFWLQISLTDHAAEQLERFTSDHLGGTVAIVVGGKVVTMHTIKDVVKGGKLQISRCGDDGCQLLFRELRDNVDD